jgi:hypothetical protein
MAIHKDPQDGFQAMDVCPKVDVKIESTPEILSKRYLSSGS